MAEAQHLTWEHVVRLLLLGQAVFVSSQAIYTSLAYVGKPNLRHIVAMGFSYSILTGLVCAILAGAPMNPTGLGIGLVAFIIGNIGLWTIREKARVEKERK